MKKVLIAADSFKESLTSKAVGEAIKIGLTRSQNEYSFDLVELADGGEGTMELITKALNGAIIKTRTHDPLGRLINTSFGLSADKKTAIIDVATSSGIELLSEEEKNPMKTSSVGTGELIKKALDYKVNTIVLGLGSSATVDLGLGLLSALGFRFLDSDNKPIQITGRNLKDVEAISLADVDPRLSTVQFKVACDVDNVLTGPNGAAHVFAKQKGANQSQIEELEKQFIRINKLLIEKLKIDLNSIPGSGAAGGIGGAMYAFLNAQLQSGSDLIIEINDIEQKIINSDIVITGEGRFDLQSLHGKGPMSVIEIAQSYNKQIILICGSVDNKIYDFPQVDSVSIFSTITKVDTLENTLADARNNIIHTATAIGNLL